MMIYHRILYMHICFKDVYLLLRIQALHAVRPGRARLQRPHREADCGAALAPGPGDRGFQGHGLSITRIRNLAPRMFACAVFSRLAILRIEGCLKSTL